MIVKFFAISHHFLSLSFYQQYLSNIITLLSVYIIYNKNLQKRIIYIILLYYYFIIGQLYVGKIRRDSIN